MKRIGFRGAPRWAAMAFATTLAALTLSSGAASAAEALERGASGLPLPRFVSLSSSEVNVRVGPSFNHKVVWTFTKSGLPVEIVREFGNWRQVRDADGEEGWVHQSLLSGRRTVLVSPWSQNENVPLRAEAKASAHPVAYLQPNVLGNVDRCDGSWCSISGKGWRGVVPQRQLWGVYPSEEVK
ncbi:SH3 domain-containing protein [Acuticoccus kandeliae]|uniref:SH3 domain-containing protein n=1 Tax=Acuticoccus kandeliae TaxID=2073160 RepID=UPI001FE6BB75|nr:SH3 domain-containing protein [Acuticoccus kandeliae]